MGLFGKWRLKSTAKIFSNPKRGGTSVFMVIAALFLILTIISYGAYYFGLTERGRQNMIEVSAGAATKQVRLSDGSEVLLKPGSTLEYPETFPEWGEHIVDFQGKARFEISANDANYFVVQSGDLTASSHETTFEMQSAIDTTKVQVMNGHVLLTTHLQQIEVEAGEVAVYMPAIHAFKKMDASKYDGMSSL